MKIYVGIFCIDKLRVQITDSLVLRIPNIPSQKMFANIGTKASLVSFVFDKLLEILNSKNFLICKKVQEKNSVSYGENSRENNILEFLK